MRRFASRKHKTRQGRHPGGFAAEPLTVGFNLRLDAYSKKQSPARDDIFPARFAEGKIRFIIFGASGFTAGRTQKSH
jgi:hypothetical protein